MVMDAVVTRFCEQSPVTLMAQLTLQKALQPAWIDTLFECNCQQQYTRQLLFSTVVELMSVVVVGLRPSLHAAAKASPTLPVSVQALYDKIKRTDPALVRTLVQGSAQQLAPVRAASGGQPLRLLKGYRLRIVDGNHFPASEKRLKPLRGLRVGALPGQSLVIYDPDLDMAVDMVPSEDAHAHERALTQPLLAHAQPGELWIGDRTFSTRAILTGWQQRGCGFIVREHDSSPHARVLTPLRRCGRIDTGAVHEQAVSIDDAAGCPLVLRRIELRLDAPTQEGETVIAMLTNLPKSRFGAGKVARLYRRRWRIEHLFQRLESVLQSEIKSLGHPRAALLAFGVALLAYNVLAVLRTAIRASHDLPAAELDISPYYLALDIRANYAGMMIAVAASVWAMYDAMSARQIARVLLRIAAHVDPMALRSHPRGPKKPRKKGRVTRAVARAHVSTARVLKEAGAD